MTVPLVVDSNQLLIASAARELLKRAITKGTLGAETIEPLATESEYEAAASLDPPQPKLVKAIEDGPRLNMIAMVQALRSPIWTEIFSTEFLHGWVNHSAGAAVKCKRTADGFVVLRGAIKDGTVTATALTLPVDCWPIVTHTQAVPSNDSYGQITVNTNGTVNIDAGSNAWLRLDGVRFPLD